MQSEKVIISSDGTNPSPDKAKIRRLKLSRAINKIITSNTDEGVILWRKKEIFQSYEDHKIEEKARRALTIRKRKDVDSLKRPLSEYDLSEERMFRKIATLGVVKLLNAIRSECRNLEAKRVKENTEDGDIPQGLITLTIYMRLITNLGFTSYLFTPSAYTRIEHLKKRFFESISKDTA